MRSINFTFLFFFLTHSIFAQLDSDFINAKKTADDCFKKGDYSCAKKNYNIALAIKENDEYCKKQLTISDEFTQKKIIHQESAKDSFSDLIGSKSEKRENFYKFLESNVNNIVIINLRINAGGYEIVNYEDKCNASLDLNIPTGYATFSIRINQKALKNVIKSKSDCWETGFFNWYSPAKQELKGKFLIKKYIIEHPISSFSTTDYTLVPL